MSRRRTIPLPLIVAAALALAGVAALVTSALFHASPRAHLRGVDVPVNPGARDPGNIDANNSPTLAQNPLRPADLAVVNRVDTPRFTCELQVSQDSGAHWSRVPVPIPAGEERKCYAPDATFASDGTLYISYVTLRGNGNRPNAAWVVHSSDGGRTLSTPQRALGPLAFQVRLATDPARPKRLYLTWLQASEVGIYRFAGPGNPIEATRSENGGASWQSPVRVSDPRRGRVLAPSPAVGPGGALYVLYLDVGDDRLDYEGAHGGLGGPPYAGRFTLVLGRSVDAGATWQESVAANDLVPIQRFISFLPPFPSLAVDPRSGRIFAAFHDARLSPSDVYLWSLAPGARRWQGPTRVNDTPAHDGTSQYMPKIAVAPNGRVDVAYYDRRNDPGNRMNEVSWQSSYDAGRTFTPHVVLSDRPFDAGIGAGSERGLPDLGSRLGLVADAGATLAAWTDTRTGTVASNKQDIAFARGNFSSSAHLSTAARDALRYGGLALLLAAAATLVGARKHLRARLKLSRSA